MSVNVGSLFYELGIEDNTKKDLAAAATATAKWEADNGQIEVKVDARWEKAKAALDAAVAAVAAADGTEAVFNMTADGAQVTTALALAESDLADAQAKYDATKLKLKVDDSGASTVLAGVEGKIKGLQDVADANPVTPTVDTSRIDDGAAEGRGSLLDMIGGWQTAAVAAAAFGGAAIANEMIEGFNAVLDQEQENDRLAASLGLSPDEAAVAGRLSGELWRDAFGESTGQVNEAVRAALLALPDGGSLGSASAEVRTISEDALNLAAIFDVEVGESIAKASVLVNTGLAPNMSAAMDLIFSGLQKIPASLQGTFMDSIDEYTKLIAPLGITGEEWIAALVKGSELGDMAMDKTGDALFELTNRASNGSATTIDAYKAMGLNAEDMAARMLAGGDTARGAFDQIVDGLLGIKDPLAQQTAAIALFGTPLEDLGVSEIPAFLTSLDTMGTGLEGVAGTAARAGTDLNDNLASKIEEVVRKLSPASLAQAFDEGGIEGLEIRVQEGVDKLKAIWEQYGPAVTAMVSEGMKRLGKLWDEKGPGIIEDLSVWWSETGGPAAEEAVKVALGMAWEGVQAYFKDKVKDPDWWMGLVEDAIVHPFSQAMTDGGPEMLLGLYAWMDQAPGAIARKAAGIWNPISDAFEGTINLIVDGWNALSFTLPEFDPFGDFGPSVGGQTISTPNLGHINIPGGSGGGGYIVGGQHNPPEFDSGGYVQAPLGKAVLAVVHGGELILNPAQQAGQAPIPGLKSKPLLSVANGDKGPVPGGYDKHSAGPSTNDKGPVPAGYHKNPGYGPGTSDKGPVPYGTIKGMADTIAAVGAATAAATGPAGTGDCECPPHMVLQDGAAIVRVEHVNSPVDMATVFQQAEFASRGAA